MNKTNGVNLEDSSSDDSPYKEEDFIDKPLKKARKSRSKRGFAAMDPDKQREIASKGGHASAKQGNTSKRGFASMSREKQREIARKGGRASAEYGDTSRRGFASMNRERQREIASKGGQASATHGDTSKRGFASMDRDRQRQIASRGGKAARDRPTDESPPLTLPSFPPIQGPALYAYQEDYMFNQPPCFMQPSSPPLHMSYPPTYQLPPLMLPPSMSSPFANNGSTVPNLSFTESLMLEMDHQPPYKRMSDSVHR